MQDIKETRLDNGLLVLTREMHAAPVAASWLWYRVGSRNEHVGNTGISHWVEHMMFKGTPRFGKGEIMRLTNRNGGAVNAMTWRDFTGYYEILPSDRFDLALEIEADRMVNSLFDQQEVESERTVIISEREGSENSPHFYLYEEMLAAAFKVHPYGHETIGWRSDLLTISRDDLYHHYRTYYNPNNAILILVGDFDTASLLDRVERLFSAIPAQQPIPPVTAVEPRQEGERRVTVRRPGGASYFSAAYHAPAAAHPDFYPMFVLSSVLSGVGSLNFSGPAASGKSARLYRALVESELATSAGASFGPSVDPDLFSVHATAREGVSLARIEEAMLAEIERIVKEPPSHAELETVKKQVKTQTVYAGDGVANLGYTAGLFEIASSYRMLTSLAEKVGEVKPEDVQRVAAAYLTGLNRTVGWFIPSEPGGGGDGGAGPMSAVQPRFYSGRRRYFIAPLAERHGHTPAPLSPGGRKGIITAQEIDRLVLPNGIVLFVRENRNTPSISLRGLIKAGGMYDTDEKAGLAQFTAEALERGTAHMTYQEINQELDGLGATLGVGAGDETVSFYGRCLKEDFDRLLAILAEVILHPTFPKGEVAKVRGEILTSLQEAKNDTRWVSDMEFHKELFPEGHPYHRQSEGTVETISQITREELAAFHRTYYRPDATTIAIVGDINRDEAVAKITAALGGWTTTGPAFPFEIPNVVAVDARRRKNVFVPGKSQADVALGVPGLPRSSPDYYAANLANMIVGVLGLYGRLGASVRDRQGLAYYVYSSLGAGVGAGPWMVRAGVNPANVDKAIVAIEEELQRLAGEPVTAEELAEAQDFLTGSLALRLETNDGQAGTLLGMELYQLGLDYLERYDGIIRGLTAEALLQAARKYLQMERLVVVVAGPV